MYTPYDSSVRLPLFSVVEPRSHPWLQLACSWLLMALLLCAVTLSGCTSVLHVKAGSPLATGVSWALLPFGDFGETPQASERAEEMARVLLRMHWGLDLERYPTSKESAALIDLDERQRFDRALLWAREQGFAYGLTGSVQEWRYRSGSDGEAAVGLTLQVINIKTGRPEWLASGSRSGLGAQTASGIAEQLLSTMIQRIRMQ
ncbi:MAG: hypothetical protein JNJ46_22480 [Myxococcales bacterium]|nr:hypothetical protein [Myxococcales bacterium]